MNVRKANSPGQVIIWIGVLMSIGMIIFFGAPKLKPAQLELEDTLQDLNSLQTIFNRACISSTLEVEYNPQVLEGELILNSQEICINSTKVYSCRKYQCEFENLDETIVLDNVLTLDFRKAGDDLDVEVEEWE